MEILLCALEISSRIFTAEILKYICVGMTLATDSEFQFNFSDTEFSSSYYSLLHYLD